jgi:hypothetical protein
VNLAIPILQSVAVLITFILTVVSLSPLFPRYNLIARRPNERLRELYGQNQTLLWPTTDGSGRNIPAGRIRDEQDGFKWVKRAIERNRPDVEPVDGSNSEIVEIGLVEGYSNLDYNEVFTEIIPGNFAYVRFENGDMLPFLRNEWENRVLSAWTSREVERFISTIIVLLILLWTVVSLLLVWIP